MGKRIQESVTAEVTVPSEASWKRMTALMMKEGVQAAKAKIRDGHHFEMAILAPRVVRGADTVPLSGLSIPLDWKLVKKREMVESARDFISNAYFCNVLDPALPVVLRAVIEEKGLYEYGIGEFFLLYGRFQQKHDLTKGAQTREKMEQLIGGQSRYMKPYMERGRQLMYPLPYAVRNILSHVGNNPNRLDQDGHDLRAAIDLLKSWVDL